HLLFACSASSEAQSLERLWWKFGRAALPVRSQNKMSSIAILRPCFATATRLSALRLKIRAFSSPSSDCSNQSRGGLPRFFSEQLPSSKGGIVRVQGDECWHMTKVLRLTADDRYNLCMELGAHSVTPLLTERSPSISENRVDRLQRVVLAATKQCQRLHGMILNPPLTIDGLLPLVSQSKLSFLATAEAAPLVSTITSLRNKPSGLIIVGPEGDFTEEELNKLIKAGVVSVGLGPLRLRVETATIALLSTLMLWSDSHQLNNS
ncbi:Ribosomal RNA small subunit methyltransferase E, partial [Linum grandiflorum]